MSHRRREGRRRSFSDRMHELGERNRVNLGRRRPEDVIDVMRDGFRMDPRPDRPPEADDGR